MKKILIISEIGLFILLCLMIAGNLFADIRNCINLSTINQMTGLDHQMIDVNKIAAWISNDGCLYTNFYTGEGGFYFPKNEMPDKKLVYSAGPWLVGKINGEIRSASVMYATEFQPGMILASGLPDDPQNPRYKIFKFTASNWDSPEMAADRAEAIVQGMEDKLYGDQMLYCVFNDGASHNGVWALPPIGIEVRMTVFGFNRPGPLGSSIFVRYVYINKGPAPLKQAYFGQFFDNDLGQSDNDMVGCDSTLGVAYAYNRDPVDDVYGTAIPCFGCDIMQGPVVSSPGDTAYLPDQEPLIDYKILRTTSFAFYTCGGPEETQGPRLQSSDGARTAYWLCSGLNSIGQKWLDPTQKNKPTKWPFAGDPITKTGWIEALTWPGSDCYMTVHAGPFDMEINKPYTFLVAHIAGLGKDHLNSIAVMKDYCRSIQASVDNNFMIPAPAPAPMVKVGQLDTTIVLSWDDRMINYVAIDKANFDSLGQSTHYTFQGFKLYQGGSISGPWKLIRQWDKDDGITRLWDYYIEPLTSELVYFPFEDGKDTGLSYHIVIDRDYLKNTRLINGKPYYYALTTYSYNPWGVPHLLENSKNPITAIPQKPLLDTEINSQPGDFLTITHTGKSDGSVVVKVIDPTKITGHDYQLTFKVNDEGVTVWDVKDVTAGWSVINNQTLQVLPEELATNDAFPIADGIQVKVVGPPAGLKNEGFNYVPSANRWLTSFSDASGNLPLWPLEGWSGLFGWAKNLYGTSVLATELKNVEIRFAATDELGNPLDPNDLNVSMAYRYLRSATVAAAKPEFEPFIINKKSGYSYQDFRPICLAAYDMESNPPRRLAVGFLENNTAAGLVNGIWFPGRFDTEGGINATREFLYIFASDYSATPKEPYTSAELLMNANNIDIMYVGVPSRRGELVPQAGDKLILSANHINSPADIFTFTTAGFEQQSSLEIAKKRLNEINVVPNPYFALNTLETQIPAQFVTFTNLSEKCIIRIFSLSGQMVRSINHENGTPFEKWDLLNEHGKSVGSGMYIVVIQVDNVGERVLKLAIINREL